jgi:hypothetical protein
MEFPALQLSRKDLQKKWMDLKDTWLKCHKKLIKEESNEPTTEVKPYIFYDLMDFLKPVYAFLG